MPTPKKVKLTIVEAYKRLDVILQEYRDEITDTSDTVYAINNLNRDAERAGLGLKLDISEAQLEQTDINPTDFSYVEKSIEPESSY